MQERGVFFTPLRKYGISHSPLPCQQVHFPLVATATPPECTVFAFNIAGVALSSLTYPKRNVDELQGFGPEGENFGKLTPSRITQAKVVTEAKRTVRNIEKRIVGFGMAGSFDLVADKGCILSSD